MTKPVPANIRAEAITNMKDNGWAPTRVVKWLNTEFNIDVTYATVYQWLHPQAKVKGSRPRGRPPKQKPTMDGLELEDGCTFSIPGEHSPMSKNVPAGPFVCAITPRVLCGGQSVMKKKCPLWASGKVI